VADKNTLLILTLMTGAFWFTSAWNSPERPLPRSSVAMGEEQTSPNEEEVKHAVLSENSTVLDTQVLLVTEQSDSESTEQPKAPEVIQDSDQATLITKNEIQNEVIKELVLKVFPESTQDDIEIWQEELAEFDAESALGILQLRKKANSSLLTLPDLTTGLPPLDPPADDTPESNSLPPLPKTDSDEFTPSPVPNEDDSRSKLTRFQKIWEYAQKVCFQNIENLHTPGYKRRAVTPAKTQIDCCQGEIRETGKPLDFAIEGAGFFAVLETKQGETFYTRNGRLSTDQEGNLCLKLGADQYALEPAINVLENHQSLHLLPDGTLIAHTTEGTTEAIGTILLNRFAHPESLVVTESGLLKASNDSGHPVVFTAGNNTGLLQGCLELSNVNSEDELDTLRRHKQQWEAVVEAVAIIQSIESQ